MYYPYLEHSGVKGMRWGVRRYQNHDGSLTPAGRAHYGVGPARKIGKSIDSALKKAKKGAGRVTKSMGKTLKNIKTNRAAKREASAERKLNKAVAKGDVKKILKRVDRMSDAELKTALNRARDVKMMKDLRQPKTPLSEKVGNVATAVTKTAGAFNAIAKARKERLEYKRAKEAYEREEDERAEKERKAWEEERAAKKAEKAAKRAEKEAGREGKKTPLERVTGEVVDWWPDNNNNNDDKIRRITGPSYTPNWRKGSGDMSKSIAGFISGATQPKKEQKQLGGPAYTPNFFAFTEGPSSSKPSKQKVVNLLPDLSSTKSSKKSNPVELVLETAAPSAKKKPKNNAEMQKTWAEVMDWDGRRKTDAAKLARELDDLQEQMKNPGKKRKKRYSYK